MSWRVFICSPNPPKNHQILIIQRMEAAQFAERNTEMIHQLQKKLVINQSIDKWLQLWTSPRLVFKHNQPTVEFVWVLVSVQTSQTKPVVKRRSNMTKSIHQGAFCCSKWLLCVSVQSLLLRHFLSVDPHIRRLWKRGRWDWKTHCA